jgi:hypothetical protein
MFGLTTKKNLELSEMLLVAALNDLEAANKQISILEDLVADLEGKSSQARLNDKLKWMGKWEYREVDCGND